MAEYQHNPAPGEDGRAPRAARGRHAAPQQARPQVPQPGSPQRPVRPASGAPGTGAPRAGAQPPYQRPVQGAPAQQRSQGGRQVAVPRGQAGAYRPAPAAAPAGEAAQYGRAAYAQQASKNRKKGGGAWRIVFVVALIVFVASLAALAVIGFSYHQGQQTYNEISSRAFTAPADVEQTTLSDLQVDWDALLAANPDTVGWIYIPGTTVNYPIVQGDDDAYYLTHDFNGSEGWIATFGAIFLSADNSADFSDANNIIYGHHLNDGSMFAPIAGFGDADAFNASRTVYLLTPQGNYRLTTFSIVHCAADDPLAQTAFASAEQQEAYVQDKVDRSEVAVDGLPAASEMTHTFAFSTCDNLLTDGRWVLFAYVSEATPGAPGAGAVSDGSANPEDVAAVAEAAEETAA